MIYMLLCTVKCFQVFDAEDLSMIYWHGLSDTSGIYIYYLFLVLACCGNRIYRWFHSLRHCKIIVKSRYKRVSSALEFLLLVLLNGTMIGAYFYWSHF